METGNVCIIFGKNFFIPEKGLTFVIGGEDSEYEFGILFNKGTYWRISVIYFFMYKINA